MKRLLFCISAASLVPMTATPAFAQQVMPLQFARGASSSDVNGSIKGREYIDYRIVVRAGQWLSVTLRPTKGSPYFSVMEPGSTGAAIHNSSMGSQSYAGTTAQGGAYTIRVYQMRASGRRGEVAKFRLSVAVNGSASVGYAPSHRPGDALVSGTPYHATTTIRCRTAQGMSMSSCKAGVIRRHGSATLHLDTPDGGERSILFRNGRAVSSDSDNLLSVQRRGDMSVVRIGRVEVYEIPDAFILGG